MREGRIYLQHKKTGQKAIIYPGYGHRGDIGWYSFRDKRLKEGECLFYLFGTWEERKPKETPNV